VTNRKSTGEQTGYVWKPDGTGDYLPLPMIDGERAMFFWPESINSGWVAGRGGIDDENSRSFAYFRYRLDTGRYERLPDRVGMPARVAANGWVLAEGSSAPVITGDAGAVQLPGYRAEKQYQLTSLSDDGLVAAGHSATIEEGAVNQPLVWRCRLSR
jgi:hypothetical protein